MKELGGTGGAELGVKLDGQFVERLLAYARSVSSFPTAVKEVCHSRSISIFQPMCMSCHIEEPRSSLPAPPPLAPKSTLWGKSPLFA